MPKGVYQRRPVMEVQIERAIKEGDIDGVMKTLTRALMKKRDEIDNALKTLRNGKHTKKESEA